MHQAIDICPAVQAFNVAYDKRSTHEGFIRGEVYFVDGSILHATSADGIVWVKHPDNPVLDLGASGTWDDYHLEGPTVLFDSTKYQMWYGGCDGSHYRIGYATSADGIVWVKHPDNPVLDIGASGTWDDTYVVYQTVLLNRAEYQMWYSGHDGSNYRIGYATSISPFPVGDVSGNRQVTAYDASLILQYTVGLIDHFPVEDMMSPSVGVPRDYVVRMPEAQAKAGDRIYVPVAINDQIPPTPFSKGGDMWLMAGGI